jgi:hypothetical protein
MGHLMFKSIFFKLQFAIMLHCLQVPAPSPKPPDRVNQIKHEENNITDRETAREK